MTMKQVYSCNICNDNLPPAQLFGCRFSGMKNFQMDGARTTDGTHICGDCARQIAEQFAMAHAKMEAET